MSLRRILPGLIAILVLAILVYVPGLSNFYLYDDYSNIVDNHALDLDAVTLDSLADAAMSGDSGPLKRPISMLSFALVEFSLGNSASVQKTINLALHLLIGIFIYLLVGQILVAWRRQYGRPLLAASVQTISLLTAALWLLHPLQVSTVLYVVQRMTQLATLFMVVGLWAYVLGRIRMQQPYPGGVTLILVTFAVCWPLALLSKETGLLLPAYTLVIEFLVFRFRIQGNRQAWLFALYGLTLALPLAAGLLLTLSGQDPFSLSGYATRPFTLMERLLTEARVLWFYLYQIFSLNLSSMGLYHDDFSISQSLTAPLTTLASVAGLMLLCTLAWRWRNRFPVMTFAIAWFLVGHTLESTIVPLHLVFEHRNYLALLGPAVGLSYYMILGLNKIDLSSGGRKIVLLLIVALTSITTTSRVQSWSSLPEFAHTQVEKHPRSSRANYLVALLLKSQHKLIGDERFARQAMHHFELAAVTDKTNVSGLVGAMKWQCLTEGEIDESRFVRLEQRLHTIKAYAETAQYLSNLGGPRLSACGLTRARAIEFVNILLQKPDAEIENKADLHNLSAIYYFNTGNLIAAENQIKQAIELAPESPLYRLGLVHLYVTQKRFCRAHSEIQSILSMSNTGQVRGRIQREQHLLRQLSGASSCL